MEDKVLGSFLGSAIGDALGAPLEFLSRDKKNITDMIAGGIHSVKIGEWTDDTSMSICLAKSLLEKGFSLEDQMIKYSEWYQFGKYSTRNRCFDIGISTKFAIENYLKTGDFISPNRSSKSSGNGSIMRLSPLVIFYNCSEKKEVQFLNLIEKAKKSSTTTHSNYTCQDSCALLAILINRALQGYSKEEMFNFNNHLFKRLEINDVDVNDTFSDIEKIKNKDRNEISSSGYVIHTLEASIWCFLNSDNFNDAILLAANLAGDADTVAAVTGQIAGAYYGFNSINHVWFEKLLLNEDLLNLSKELYLKSKNNIC